jgi:hypothetical protein
MTKKRGLDIICGNTRAVVGDSDISHSARTDFNRNNTRTRINGIFDKLLNNGRRSLNNLPRSNKIRNMLFKLDNLCHTLLLYIIRGRL